MGAFPASRRIPNVSHTRFQSMPALMVAIAVAATVILCTMLPFLPGPYDPVAVAASAMAQVFGIMGLFVAPVGALWVAYEWTRRVAPVAASAAGDKWYRFAAAALIALLAVCAGVSLAAFAFSGLCLGSATLAGSIYLLRRCALHRKHLQAAGRRPGPAVPFCLLFVPVTVVVFQTALTGPAADYSRGRAIRNSEPLIADIERYRTVHGHYPLSLQSVSTDYRPMVIGIRRYEYEPSGSAYNLFFEQRAPQLDTREIVMYNKLDQHIMSSHDSDLLHFSGAELNVRRGFYAVRPAASPHWKYFWFD
jgi:hypothetical protein